MNDQPTEAQLRERLRRRRIAGRLGYGQASAPEWDEDPIDSTICVATDYDVSYVQHPIGFDYDAAKAEYDFAQRTTLDQQSWDVAVGKNWTSLEASVKEYITLRNIRSVKAAQSAADAQAAAEYRRMSTLGKKLARAAANMKVTQERAAARGTFETVWERGDDTTVKPKRGRPLGAKNKNPKPRRPSGTGGITDADRKRWARRARQEIINR